MNRIWYLKYTHNGNKMKVEMELGFEDNFKGELDRIYTTTGVKYDKVRDASIAYPFLRRVEVWTKFPEVWEDMMAENFIAEKEKLRTEIMEAMGIVRE
ncbi:MAG: hypothetical protein ACRC45_04275 [Cetobacterium sp.]